MRIAKKQLLNLRVITVKGFTIGRVFDLSFDTESQSVIQYEVHSSWIASLKLTPLPSRQSFLIHRDQVIRMNDKELVVQDGAIPELSEHERKFAEALKGLNGAIQPEPTLSEKNS